MQLRYIEDYYDKVKERFPDLEMWEIEKILKHGMQSFFMLNAKGADVIIKSAHNSFVMYFGKLFNNNTVAWKYYTIKWRIKLRLKYLLKKPIWDGYYYFGLTEEDYNKYIPKKKGRYKKKIIFDNIYAYKIKEEAFLFHKAKYFFRLKVDTDEGFTFKRETYATRNLDLIAKRDNTGKIQNTYE